MTKCQLNKMTLCLLTKVYILRVVLLIIIKLNRETKANLEPIDYSKYFYEGYNKINYMDHKRLNKHLSSGIARELLFSNTKSRVYDLSAACVAGWNTSYILTSGNGLTDTVVFILSYSGTETEQIHLPHCNIYFKVLNPAVRLPVMAVDIQFPLVKRSEKMKCIYNRTNHPTTDLQHSYFIFRNSNGTILKSLCKNFLKTGLKKKRYYKQTFATTDLIIEIKFRRIIFDSFIKFMVVAGRKLPVDEKCNPINEYFCNLNEDGICLSNMMECDSNINCGVNNYLTCDPERVTKTRVTVFASFALGTLLVLILLYILWIHITPITDNFFIFNEGEDNKLIIRTLMRHPLTENQYQQSVARIKKQSVKPSSQGSIVNVNENQDRTSK